MLRDPGQDWKHWVCFQKVIEHTEYAFKSWCRSHLKSYKDKRATKNEFRGECSTQLTNVSTMPVWPQDHFPGPWNFPVVSPWQDDHAEVPEWISGLGFCWRLVEWNRWICFFLQRVPFKDTRSKPRNGMSYEEPFQLFRLDHVLCRAMQSSLMDCSLGIWEEQRRLWAIPSWISTFSWILEWMLSRRIQCRKANAFD